MLALSEPLGQLRFRNPWLKVDVKPKERGRLIFLDSSTLVLTWTLLLLVPSSFPSFSQHPLPFLSLSLSSSSHVCHCSSHLHFNTLSFLFSLCSYLAFCVYLSILLSLIVPWLYQYPHPTPNSYSPFVHLSFSGSHTTFPPICFPIPLMDDAPLLRGPQSENQGFAVKSNLKANSADSHHRVLLHDVTAITCGTRERERTGPDAAATLGRKTFFFFFSFPLLLLLLLSLLSNRSIEKCISLEFGHFGTWKPQWPDEGWFRERSLFQQRE